MYLVDRRCPVIPIVHVHQHHLLVPPSPMDPMAQLVRQVQSHPDHQAYLKDVSDIFIMKQRNNNFLYPGSLVR